MPASCCCLVVRLLPPALDPPRSAEGAYIAAQLLERAQHAPPLRESWWELPPVGSHGHPPPPAQRRALRWPPQPAAASPAPAASGDRPHRSERAVRRPTRYAGEEEPEERGEVEEGSFGGYEPAAVAPATAAPAASSGGPAIQAVATPRGLGSRQAESHAYASVQGLHEADEAAAAAQVPGPGRTPLVVDSFGGGSPYAHVPVQQVPPWLAGSPSTQPAGFTAWAGSWGGADRHPVVQRSSAAAAPPPPPHPTTPPAAAGGATLPFLQDSQVQRKLAGPPQHGNTAQQGPEHWLEVAAAQLPIPQQEADADAATGAALHPARQAQAARELMRAIAAATQQPAH